MRAMIAGGGTGGHLFPGLAVAEELRTRCIDVVFAGTSRGIETTAVPAAGFPLELVPVTGLVRVGAWGFVTGFAKLPKAYLASRAILRKHAPDVVMGVGGYAAGPVTLTAKSLGLPTAILEQNSVPGLTNRILGRFVDRVFASFEVSRPFFPAPKFVLSGNPLRRRLVDLAEREEGAARADAPSSRDTRILILGGSQGAHALNELLPSAIAKVGARLAVKHQTGERDLASVSARYRELRVDAEVTAFIEDMASAYQAADLVIARAGATTIAEIAAIGRPALLIPLPTAANDHQTKNAAALADAGAAVVVPQPTATADRIAELVTEITGDHARLRGMGDAARALGRPGATREIADALVALARSRGEREGA